MKHENGIEIAFRAGAPMCTMNTEKVDEGLHYFLCRFSKICSFLWGMDRKIVSPVRN